MSSALNRYRWYVNCRPGRLPKIFSVNGEPIADNVHPDHTSAIAASYDLLTALQGLVDAYDRRWLCETAYGAEEGDVANRLERARQAIDDATYVPPGPLSL